VSRFDRPPAQSIDVERTYQATVETSAGTIELDLHATDAPAAVNNFVFLAREGFYDGVVFHRVIAGFMIQGGDPEGSGRGGPGYRFDDELALARTHGYPRGTLAMANSGPNTNGSQFFIVHEDAGLPPQYTVFGDVRSGIEVVDTIAATATNASDRPLEDVVIDHVTIHEL
jgi:peptidyl-prolyl cis-trans isomerase B (cyclophilin B)